MKVKQNQDVLLFILALAVLAFSLVSLFRGKDIEIPLIPDSSPGINSAGAKSNGAKSGGTNSVSFIHSWEARETLLSALKNEYEESHPGITITISYRPYDELKRQLFSLARAGTDNPEEDAGYDIAALDPRWVEDLLEQERIAPQVFPLISFMHPLFYNTEILGKGGFNRPPKTWTEFLAQSRKITSPETGVRALALALAEENPRGLYRDIYSWIWPGFIEPVGPLDIKDPSIQRALTFLLTLEKENLLLPGTFALGEDEKKAAFIAGRTAFMIGSAEDTEALRLALGNRLGYTAIPVPDTYLGKPIFTAGGWTLALHAQSRRKDKALSFIRFLENQKHRLAEEWAIPENVPPLTVQDPFYSKAREFYLNGELRRGNPGTAPRDELLRLFSAE